MRCRLCVFAARLFCGLSLLGLAGAQSASAPAADELEGMLRVHPKFHYRYYIDGFGDGQKCALFGADDRLRQIEQASLVRVRGDLECKFFGPRKPGPMSALASTWVIYMNVQEVEVLRGPEVSSSNASGDAARGPQSLPPLKVPKEPAWGPAVEALSPRLSSTEDSRHINAPPRLRLEIEHRGERPLRTSSNRSLQQHEVAGAWWARLPYLANASTEVLKQFVALMIAFERDAPSDAAQPTAQEQAARTDPNGDPPQAEDDLKVLAQRLKKATGLDFEVEAAPKRFKLRRAIFASRVHRRHSYLYFVLPAAPHDRVGRRPSEFQGAAAIAVLATDGRYTLAATIGSGLEIAEKLAAALGQTLSKEGKSWVAPLRTGRPTEETEPDTASGKP